MKNLAHNEVQDAQQFTVVGYLPCGTNEPVHRQPLPDLASETWPSLTPYALWLYNNIYILTMPF